MKIICIYHSRDLDGWMSAAIVKHWFEETVNRKGEEDIPVDSLDFIGYDYGQPIPDLNEYDKVIMCDVSFPPDKMEEVYDSSEFIWIDHHKSAIEASKWINNTVDGLRDTNYAACELTWKYFFPDEEIPEIVRLLGRYDCFGHKGTDEEQKVLEFQYGARHYMNNYNDCYTWLTGNGTEESLVNAILDYGIPIYQYLCTEAKQIYSKAFEILLVENKEDVTVGEQVKKFLCVNQERFNPINFGIDYHKEGYDGFACFWLKDGKWMWSLYNDNGQVDCSLIAKQYGGGGHKGAAGFVCDRNTMLNIIKRISKI